MIYETETKYTLDETLKLNKVLTLKLNKGYVAFVIICMAVALIAAIFSISINRPFYAVLFLIAFIIFPLTAVLSIYLKAVAAYKSGKMGQDCIVKSRFFDDHFESESPFATSSIKYDRFYRIIETKDRIYLFISKIQAFPVIKDNFPQELLDMLRSKDNYLT